MTAHDVHINACALTPYQEMFCVFPLVNQPHGKKKKTEVKIPT